MSLFDLTFNKPAVKRIEVVDATDETRTQSTEAVESEAVESEAVESEAVESEAVESEAVESEAVESEAVESEAVESEAVEETSENASKSSGRLRRTARNVGLFGVGVVGLLTLRKLRGRRTNTNKNKAEIVTEIETETGVDSTAE